MPSRGFAAKLEDMFVSHLESALDGTRFEAGRIQSVHEGRPLWVRYDLNQIRKAIHPGDFPARPPSLWRYRFFRFRRLRRAPSTSRPTLDFLLTG